MQVSSASVSTSKRRDLNHRSGSRLRKKHKRLDSICEEEYNRNHGESNENNGDAGTASGNLELRRSSRVRRAPEVLDASPAPAKKRRRIDRNVNLSVDKNARGSLGSVKEEENENMGESETPGSWRSRLRRRRNVGFEVKEERPVTSRRRKLFEEIGVSREEVKVVGSVVEEKQGDLESGTMMVVKSKRPGRIKAMNGSGDGEEKVELCGVKHGTEREEVEVSGNEGEESVLALESRMGDGNEREMVDVNAMEVVEEEGREMLNGSLVEEGCIGNDIVDAMECSDKQAEPFGNDIVDAMDGENQQDVVEVEVLTKQAEDGGSHDWNDNNLTKLDEKPLEVENVTKVDELNRPLADTLEKPCIKQGRRCGLCGGGTDGKPPKRLVHDMGESENEAYSGYSASEEPNYDIWDGFGDEPGWLGRLLGPINDRYGIAGIWVHQHCAVWSPEVYFAGLGCLKNVRAALCRGRALKCSRCGRPGATIGCRVDRCPKTYHLPCARANSCIFDHRKFLIACTDHRYLFQPHGNRFLTRIKKMKARKMKLEIRKLSNEAWRKDVEAEEKWLENCGEDEEFLKREGRRLHRDLLRIAPVYIGGSDSEGGNLFEGWESVAGLQDVIQCLKEVVILPLLYPEFFNNLGLTPPRGVLLHGYPGTGKTLVVRALIGSCARGGKRIAYFARKGADCLGKYVGDAERQLRLLFQVAERCQPSIIFFDEIDGLAPCRTRQQDQTHSSVVSTLLALLDGLKSRGSVVVIGATNRPEAVDPALRRPGRFDREIHFPLPSVEDRASILSLHTQKWPKPVTGSLLKWIAKRTIGFAGADLQSLCTQAAIIALKRNFPLQKVLSTAGEKATGTKRVSLPAFAVEERDWLEALLCSPPPCSLREAGMAAYDLVSSPLPTHLVPCLLQPLITLLVSLHLDGRLWLPPTLSKAATMLKSVIVSALDKKKLPIDCWGSYVDDFLQEADVVNEIERRLSYAGLLMGEASIAGTDAFIDDANNDNAMFEPPIVHNGGTHTSMLQNISYASRKKSGFRILVAGSPRSGQRHLAACLLHCFIGNVEIQKVDLATISQEGHGDLVYGVTRILMKCSSVGSCVVFMPRIDLWAVETLQQVTKGSDSSPNHQSPEKKESCLTHSEVAEKENESCLQQGKSTETEESQGASLAWSSFVEQVESICVSTSFMILATSEVPYPVLPRRIRQFFESRISNCSQSIPFEHTVPRFTVQLGGNFNQDMVFNLSAGELSRDIIQLLVQLIHQRTHIHTSSCMESKTCDSIEGCTDTAHGPGKEHEGRAQCPDDPFLKVPSLPNNRTLKGKSSLLLAISTFGYQILRYPHFAELCWVTSKLKEGPCADISGPWKGWPFNSCIIRPNDSVDKVAVACTSSNTKSKEKSGLVRGLIAVGLLAYRGVYASLREVSIEVRKVLELLVGQINAKIQAGKDRYQYVRLSSQVAYLEDMVTGWAYALQSLELDAQMKVANPKLSPLGSPDNHMSVDKSVQSEECKPSVSNGSYHESVGLDECPQGFASENVECVDLNNGNIDFKYPNSEGKVSLSEKGSAQKIVLSAHTTPDKHLHASAVVDQSVGKITNEQNGTNLGLRDSENTANVAVLDGNFVSLEHSNGFISTESVVTSKNGLCSFSELGGNQFSATEKYCNQINGLPIVETRVISNDGEPDPSEHSVDINFSSSKTISLSADSGIVCLYRCCPQCLRILRGLLRKILIQEWVSNRSYLTVEDVHDVVASLSVDLLSAIRKVYVAGGISESFDEILRYKICGKLSECPELSICHCKSSGNSLFVPTDCSCHSVGGGVTEENTFPHTDVGIDPKFIFRDGVLVPVDSKKDVSFHCKFETLCLCSLIELIVMTKQPFD